MYFAHCDIFNTLQQNFSNLKCFLTLYFCPFLPHTRLLKAFIMKLLEQLFAAVTAPCQKRRNNRIAVKKTKAITWPQNAKASIRKDISIYLRDENTKLSQKVYKKYLKQHKLSFLRMRCYIREYSFILKGLCLSLVKLCLNLFANFKIFSFVS